ncbi:MAG: hypothetical protein JJU05_00460 [Verrucomicrobia bacterium]|nr:hypothetical protein [Verrucomicrobiota bacterium]MCH8526298.1 hypothetical protein [Kiritimatiellia bacterium]
MVEEAAAGTRIMCPICEEEVLVPVVKTASLASPIRSGSERTPGPLLKSRITDMVYDVQEAAESLARKAEDQERLIALIGDAVAVTRERLMVFERHLEPVHFKQSPSESIVIPESWTPVPKQTLWKPLTLGFGILAFFLALALAMRAG